MLWVFALALWMGVAGTVVGTAPGGCAGAGRVGPLALVGYLAAAARNGVSPFAGGVCLQTVLPALFRPR